MFNATELQIEAFVERLQQGYRRTYGRQEPEFPEILAWAGSMALENIANSDALYHDVEHTIHVTLVGQDILRGKLLHQPVAPVDWLHFIFALLCHDIGYVRGVCSADDKDSMIVDESGMILYHPDSNQVGNFLDLEASQEPIFKPNMTASDGTRQMLYIHPVPGRSWVTVTVIPAEVAQQVALENAAPLLSLMLLMAGIGYLVIRIGLRVITSSIQKLAQESEKIAEGIMVR